MYTHRKQALVRVADKGLDQSTNTCACIQHTHTYIYTQIHTYTYAHIPYTGRHACWVHAWAPGAWGKGEHLAVRLLVKVYMWRKGVWGQRVLVVCECVKGREQGSRKLLVSAYYLFPRKEFIFNR